MAWTQTDLDAINEAIALGALKVTYADRREVTFRSLADMRSIRDEIEKTLNPTQPTRVTIIEHRR